jgi:hypothetical protein
MWKTDFNPETIKLARPQGLWKKCAKASCLWKIQTIGKVFRNFHRLKYAQPVEMWKTLFKY